jgi:hypothetical protein
LINLIKIKKGDWYPLFCFCYLLGNIYLETEGIMKKENNSYLIKNLDNIAKTFMNNVSIENYFTLSSDKKLTTQYLFLKFIIKSIINVKSKHDQDILKMLIGGMLKRCEEIENYELAEVTKDMKSNFDSLFEMTNEPIKPKRTIKTTKSSDS